MGGILEQKAVLSSEFETPTSDIKQKTPLGTTIIHSSPQKQQYWIGKRDMKLESAYSKIAPNIPSVNVNHKDLFIKKCGEYYKQLEGRGIALKNIERWDDYEIVRMFGKGLNPTSLETARKNIEFFTENLVCNEDTLRVVEYGPGSGWSTIMLMNYLKKRFPEKKIELYTVDMSPHSVVATQNSLDYHQIPWQTVLENSSVEDIEKKDGVITIVLEDFMKFTQKQPNDYFHGYFSSHGTAYLSEEEYFNLLKFLKEKGKRNAVFVADSLDPLYTVELNTIHLLLCSFFPSLPEKMKEYSYSKSLRSNSKYFSGQEVKKITKVNNAESRLFYNWNHYLLSHFKYKYLIRMMESIKITTDVIEEYREDVYPSYLVNTLVKREELNGWKPFDNLPKCPLYITNCGFFLDK